jgi:ATP-dependent Clp protease ATP-binding subunit ClpC
LDDGHITDAQGRKVSFKNTIVIMTSNAGAQNIVEPKRLGFASVIDETEEYKRMKDGVMDEVKRIFKPEFINRIDEIIVFHQLTKENIKQIVGIMIASIGKRSKAQMNISLETTDEVVAHLAEVGFDPKYGARPLRRAIQTNIEDKLAEAILAGTIKEGDKVLVEYLDNEMVVRSIKI